MAQLSEDRFAVDGAMMSVEAAVARLAERLATVTARTDVPLAAAGGRVLAADVVAPRPVPPHDNSAVDGYAVFFDDLLPTAETVLPVTGRVAAGHTLGRAGVRGEAVRIFTGAPMPSGFDTVLMQEDCRSEAEGARVVIRPGITRGANRRVCGEDVAPGAVVLAAGRRLRPQDIGLAASLGFATLPVRAPLRVAVFSTGDELHEPADTASALPDGGIFDANRFTLGALLRRLGCAVTDLGILRDDPAVIRAALAEAAASHQVLITSGGVSIGDEDHVKAAVEALGRLHLWRLAIKPGRPMALGQVGEVPFIGLPGNPVAVMITFLCVARPLILHLMGATPVPPRRFPARVCFSYSKKAGPREYLRVHIDAATDGAVCLRKYPRDGAGVLSSMVDSDGLAILPETLTRLTEGDVIEVIPFSELL